MARHAGAKHAWICVQTNSTKRTDLPQCSCGRPGGPFTACRRASREAESGRTKLSEFGPGTAPQRFRPKDRPGYAGQLFQRRHSTVDSLPRDVLIDKRFPVVQVPSVRLGPAIESSAFNG